MLHRNPSQRERDESSKSQGKLTDYSCAVNAAADLIEADSRATIAPK